MDATRTLISVATVMLAAGAIAAGAATTPSTVLYHDMVVQAIGSNVADSTVNTGPDSTLYHDM